jgi:hypothetical protein
VFCILKKYEITFLGIISVLMFVIFVSGCITSNHSASKKSISIANMTFENDAVKFNYPVNLEKENLSGKDSLDNHFYNGTATDPNNMIGSIACGVINGTGTRNSFSTWNNTTICGYHALHGKNNDYAGAVLFIRDDVALSILFNPAYESAADRIIDSLVIKRVPVYEIHYNTSSSISS